MIRFRRGQWTLSFFTLVMLIVTIFSMVSTSRLPEKYSEILTAASASAAPIIFAQQETQTYLGKVEGWINRTIPKSDVENSRVLFIQHLNTIDLSSTSITYLVYQSFLKAVNATDALIQRSPQGILPIALQSQTRAALTPALKNITGLGTKLTKSIGIENEARSSLFKSDRQKTLTRNLNILFFFFLLLLILVVWALVTFSRDYKSAQISIKTQIDDLELSNEYNQNLSRIALALQGQRDLTIISKTILSELATLLNVQQGVFYLVNSSSGIEARLQMLSSYAFSERVNTPKEWKMGEGLVGQCAVEKKRILVTDVPDDYIVIASGLGNSKPLNIGVLPIIFEGNVNGVIELASFTRFSATQLAFLDRLTEYIGIVIHTIEIDMRTDELLKQSQSLTDELQSQQEELRETNQELEEKAQLLREQKIQEDIKNREIELANAAVEEKASQLALTSKYKSEFLSNMSHELRTPLNSLLILAELLTDNSKNHLDAKEVEFAKLILVSGNDLLTLINEILDLSKIESGTVLVSNEPVHYRALQDHIENTFRHVSKDRNIEFEMSFANDLPSVFITDEMRLLQIMKNLLSNAFKFTSKGRVSLRVDPALDGWSAENKSLNTADGVIAFTVEDTGIGISPDKQRIIFEAFQQGDGRTARKYGGTGLGLSISREIARLLGGELALLNSTLNQGSAFILYLPQNGAKAVDILKSTLKDNQRPLDLKKSYEVEASTAHKILEAPYESGISDDRNTIEHDRVLLIIEDDPTFAKIILDLAHEKGFKGIVALSGTQALDLARQHMPDAITLDIHIPDIDGWSILDTLKRDPDLRHIPVDVITIDESPVRSLSQGAFRHLTKPVSRLQLAEAIGSMSEFLDRPVKNLLLVAADRNEDEQITELLGNDGISVSHASSGKLGLVEMKIGAFDCVVVATKLPDMSIADFITAARKDKLLKAVPVVVFSSAPISDAEREEFEKLGTTSVVTRTNSFDRLFDQTSLFLHQIVSKLPEDKRTLLRHLQNSTNILVGKKVLIVDDDARNIIALTAAMELRGLSVFPAENGYRALDSLKKIPNIDLVLMDIMMPEMDGYECMREIRKLVQYKKLPIIALTAKAMVGDREKCLEAGASDYLSKPVNIEQLSSLMQVWLSK